MPQGSDTKQIIAEYKVMVRLYLEYHAEPWLLLEEKAQGVEQLCVRSTRRIS